MLAATGISLGFAGQQVLSDVNLTLDRTNRTGLVGANGSGKTTLLKILAGLTQPDAGTVSTAKALLVDYLPQKMDLPADASVYEVAEEGYSRERLFAEEREQLVDRLKRSPDDQSLLRRVSELDQLLETAEYAIRHVPISRVLRGLGFQPEQLQSRVGTLSGGWAMRVALARTLLSRPDFLLLDEPTNYLDSESRLWLSQFLVRFSGGFLLVSHDRAFLDDTIDEVLELFLGRVKRYRGSFSAYEKQRREELDILVKKWEEQQREIARQEDFIRRFRAQANKARQVQSRIKMLEKTERLQIPEHLRPITISLPKPPHAGRTVITISELRRAYEKQEVLSNISCTIERGTRLAVVGKNGAGKTTLLRILAGQDQNHDGTINLGSGVMRGYFAQDSPEKLPSGTTVLEYLQERASDANRPRVRDLLGAFLFSGDDVEKTVDVLSGGERSRLAMASLLLRPVNLLILDEPTNHLDLTSQEVLAQALQGYPGTVIFVSHDRHFLREVATDVLALWDRDSPIPDGWRLYPGTYSEFESSSLGGVFFETDSAPGNTDEKESGSNGEKSAADDYQLQKIRKGELRRLERLEVEQMREIEELEQKHKKLQQEMARPEVYTDATRIRGLQEELHEIDARLESLHCEWEETTEQIESISS